MSSSSFSVAVTRPRVLFVGDDHTSPQIAAALLRQAAGDLVEVHTAGTQTYEPGGRNDEMLVAMGLDPADEHRLSARELHVTDRVVILGTDLDVARLPGPVYEEWDLEDDLVERVQVLTHDLTTAAEAPDRSLLDRAQRLVRALRRR